MIFAIDYDGTVVTQDSAYEDLVTPPVLMPGAEQALRALKRAGHQLLLYSARSNLALREDWKLNPLWNSCAVPLDMVWWLGHRELARARYQQMVDFCAEKLPGVFDAIDDGRAGKPTGIDLFIDDRAFGWDYTGGWEELEFLYGEPEQLKRAAP